MMVGDGLNDLPSLALADVSVSFSAAIDASQKTADVIIEGYKLQPLLDLFSLVAKTKKTMLQNLAISLCYNLIALPFAVAGFVVPLVAAFAMSSSSLLVLFNSLRINKCQT
jgi:Cu2+-exporting ATPase